MYEPPGFAGSIDFSFLDTFTATHDVGDFQAGYYEIALAASRAEPAIREASDRSQAPETVKRSDSKNSPTSSRLKDLAIKGQLQAMQQNSSVPSNLVSTQMESVLKGTQVGTQRPYQAALSAVAPPRHRSGVGVNWSAGSQWNITPAKMAELIVQAWGLEAHNQSFTYVMDMDQLRKNNKIKRLNPGTSVNCECGSDHEEDAMVRRTQA
jgi:hypothetical protein